MSAPVAVAVAVNNKAKDANCCVIISKFSPKEASIKEMKEYSSCVDRLYPEISEMTQGETIFVKVSILCAIIGVVIGVYKGYKNYGDVLSGVTVGVFGCFIGAMTPSIILLTISAIMFLFS